LTPSIHTIRLGIVGYLKVGMGCRREFLKTASAGALAALTTQTLLTAAAEQTALSVPGKEDLIVRSFRFLDLETPVEFMTDWIIPHPTFFCTEPHVRAG
jgi:hypothetical protein